MSLYNYLDPDDIRLLTVNVHNGATESLELHTYSRAAAPEYDAVSYSWGDDKSTTSVVCNGILLEVRIHLFRALPFIHDFRPEPKTQALWVDAICLNQGDREEKAIHVPRMGEIYENAARTLIWLGEAAAKSDLAMNSIERLTQKMSVIGSRDTLTIRQTLINYDLPPPNDQVWESIKVLELRPWFFRLWTLQEIVLSKQAVLLCGCKSVSWNALVALQEVAIQAKLETLFQAEVDPETPYKKAQILIRHIEFLRQHPKKGNINLPMLLTMSADRGYSLPVDRVWAMIGMLNKRYQKLIRDAKLVDYSEAAISNYHETFMSMVKFHVKHDTCVAMSIIEDNFRTVSNSLLPSWVPDWHTDKGTIPLARWPEALAGIPGEQYHRIEPFMQANEDFSLELCGLIIDVVEYTTESAGKNLLDLESFPWLIKCLEIINRTPFVHYDVYPSTAAIPAIPSTYADGTPMSEQWQRYKRAEEVLKYVLFPPDLLDTSPRTMLRCNGRKFFCTKASRLGIGPADLQEGDLLCAMYGARTIWALRPVASPETRGTQTSDLNKRDIEDQAFRLLGSAYTPSLLKGQAWIGTSCESMRRFKLR